MANLIVLRLGWAARLSRWARSKAGPLLAAFLFAVPYLLLITIITAPYVLYTDFFREHAYGLSNQGFAEWGGEQLIDCLVQRQARPTVDITAPKPHASWR